MMNWFPYHYVRSRSILLIFSVFFILISMLAPVAFAINGFTSEDIGLKIYGKGIIELLGTHSINDIYMLLISDEDLFKLPHTFLRYILFSIGLFLMIYAFSLSLKKDIQPHLIIKNITLILITLYFLLNLLTPNGLSFISLLLTIISLYYIIFCKRKIVMDINEKILISSLLVIFYYALTSAITHDSNIRELDNYTRFLFAIPIYIFLRDIKIKPELIFNIINISSILIGLYALYASLIDGQSRVYGYTSTTTIYSNISMLHFFFSFILFNYNKNSSKSTTLSLLGMLFAISAVMLTGSRGPLFAIPLVFLFFLLKNRIFLFNVKHIMITLLMITLFSYLSGVTDRVIDGYNDVKLNINSTSSPSWKSTGSIMPRIILWKGSINMIKKNPYSGVGLDKFNKNIVNQINNKEIPAIRADFDNPSGGFNHAHNQYLDLFAKTGIFGLILLLLLLSIFFKIFYFALSFKNETMVFGLLGVTTIISYSSFMLSHVVLAHQHSILFMLYTLMIFASIISNRINNKDQI